MTTTQQPTWKLEANLGDVHPLDYGGYFVYVDETSVYAPEAELMEVPEEGLRHYTVYRFSLDRCTFENGILSDNPFHKNLPAWFAKPEEEKANRPQDSTYLSRIAETMDSTVDELRAMFCSENVLERAQAYRMVGECHGFINLDQYPIQLTKREAIARYK